MSACELCGGPRQPDDPLLICSRCLFLEALGEVEAPASNPVTVSQAPTVGPAAQLRFSSRRDFFEKYALQERIGVGGQGEVYLCWDYDFRRLIAMKRLGAAFVSSPAAVGRFFAEAQVASQLQHPGVLPVYDVGLDPDGRPFFTTALVSGTRLADELGRDAAEDAEEHLNQVLNWLVRVCEVMAHAHSRGVIHRDLKPSNILVGQFGDVRVIDWGSAFLVRTTAQAGPQWWLPWIESAIETDRAEALRDALDSPLATANSGQPVTLLYTAPELLADQRVEPGPQADIYSVGVILYQLATGCQPHQPSREDSSDRTRIKARILAGPPPSPRAVRPSISRDLDAICRKAMARACADRYATMLDLAADLRSLLENRPVAARPLGAAGQVRKWVQRNRSVATLATALLLVAAVGGGIAFVLRLENRLARQLATLGDARLAARSGQWRSVLEHLEAAETAGYGDGVDLTLQRIEAWSELNSNGVAQAAVNQLAGRSGVDVRHRGALLLTVGEYELSSPATHEQGLTKVREALAGPLDSANQAFAKALLATNSTNALALVRQALRLNPFHRPAYRHCLGLEFLLGLHEELEADLKTFRTLFPDDPSYVLFAASQRAVTGDEEGALKLIQEEEQKLGPKILDPFRACVQIFSVVPKVFQMNPAGPTPASAADIGKLQMLAWSLFVGPGDRADSSAGLRFPLLPCLSSYLDAAKGLSWTLLSGGAGLAVNEIVAAHRQHPEAFLPFAGALLMERQMQASTNQPVELVSRQAQLYQLAADSPSFIPNLPRSSRLLAARSQLRLHGISPGEATSARIACLDNLRHLLLEPATSATAIHEIARIAMRLGEHDLAREAVVRWEQQDPGSEAALRVRISLELATGAFGRAYELSEQLLKRKPASKWAVVQRQAAREGAEKTARELGGSSP